jgi:hypothetical protein
MVQEQDERTDIYEECLDLLDDYMWNSGKLHFAKLYIRASPSNIGWTDDDVYEAAKNGCAKVFWWMLANNNANMFNSGEYVHVDNVTLNIYRKAVRFMGYKLNDPDMVTIYNVPVGAENIAIELNEYYIKPQVFNKILSFNGGVSVWDVFGEALGGKYRLHRKRVSLQLIDVLYENIQTLEFEYINTYQELIDKYHPDITIIDELMGHCGIDKRLPGTFINKGMINECRDHTLTIGICDEQLSQYARDLSGYCGIMASDYDDYIIDIITNCLWSSCIYYLELAWQYKHKKMIYLMIDRIRSGCLCKTKVITARAKYGPIDYDI